MPARMESANSSAVQPPMPVSLSGVILVEYTVPNGVRKATPPDMKPPPAVVWHAVQFPRQRQVATAVDDFLALEKLEIVGSENHLRRAVRTRQQRQCNGRDDDNGGDPVERAFDEGR